MIASSRLTQFLQWEGGKESINIPKEFSWDIDPNAALAIFMINKGSQNIQQVKDINVGKNQ